MRVLIPMALGTSLLAAGPAFAEEKSICDNAQTTIEIGECVGKEYKKADAELNAVWKEVMATFKNNDYMPAEDLKAWKDTLLASQRDWIKFKEEDCEAVGYEWFGGTGRSNAVVFCLLHHTTARTKDLKARFLER
ncbi:lysozyme inhibitor LprI family protein [Methyloceanibacter sp. wino2]|uniref:lysozyme inhibitor LprI family protein n=1 Tax=Methyloceanibacter sp. wino2 TaxID=2170729 RepID=UPI000D3E7B69|nr:lysozyme inhibitor LprI family protein [Methyloceanibacter sp. wino2]